MKRFSVTVLITAALLVAVAETGADAQPNGIDTLSYMCMEPSPRAASLLRYGEYEVSAYSGQPVIEIPVWTISTSWCTVPVSFRYRGGDIKYDDISGELGLGWDIDGRLIGRALNPGGSPLQQGFIYNSLGRLYRLDGSWSIYFYDACGRMTTDGPHQAWIDYNVIGKPYGAQVQYNEAGRYSYLADGTKAEAHVWGGDTLVYAGDAVFRKSGGVVKVEGIAVPGGRIVGAAEVGGIGNGQRALCYITDHLGSTRLIIDGSNGNVMDRMTYTPMGRRWTATGSGPVSTLATNRYRYNGKEEQELAAGMPYTDYGSRFFDPDHYTWLSPDPLSGKYPGVYPYAFCAGDPVNYVDPDGRKIVGNSRKDTEMVIRDLKEIFRDDVFTGFRELLVQSGKKHNGRSLAKISSQQLEKAFDGVNLNEDQQHLVDMVVNTINSTADNVIEYIKPNEGLSDSAVSAFSNYFSSQGVDYNTLSIDNPILLSKFLINQFKGGTTVKTETGSFSLVLLGGIHPNGIPVTTGHELFGHGRSLSIGRINSQDEDAIQTENLILRVMGIHFINNGLTHGNGYYIPNHSSLPAYK